MELALVRLFNQQMDASGRFTKKEGGAKAVYLAPAKALVNERVGDWKKR